MHNGHTVCALWQGPRFDHAHVRSGQKRRESVIELLATETQRVTEPSLFHRLRQCVVHLDGMTQGNTLKPVPTGTDDVRRLPRSILEEHLERLDALQSRQNAVPGIRCPASLGVAERGDPRVQVELVSEHFGNLG